MTNNPNDDLENFDDSQYADLEAELDASYDEPLPDDLSDDLGVEDEMPQDEDFGTDDNWDDQSGDMQGDDQPQEKKKSSFLTYAIIGVVALGGGAFALSQLGGGSAPSPQPAEIAAQNDGQTAPLEGLRDEAAEQAALEPVQNPGAAPAPAAAPQGFMNEAPSLPSGPSLTAVDSAPEAVLPEEGLQPVPVTPAAEAPADPAVITGLKPLSDFPSVDQIKKSDPAPIAAAPVVPSGEASTEVAPVPAVNTAELAVMQGKLDAAQTKIDTLEKELSAAKSVAAPVPVSDNSASEAVITELEEKVTSLEQKLTARDSELAKAKKAAEAVPAAPAAEAPVATTRRSSEDVAPAPVARTAPVVKQTVSWELRGAQPGKVLLSRKGMGDDVRSVSLGDTVPGLGKIVSIDRTSAGWVVKGTQGSVSQ